MSTRSFFARRKRSIAVVAGAVAVVAAAGAATMASGPMSAAQQSLRAQGTLPYGIGQDSQDIAGVQESQELEAYGTPGQSLPSDRRGRQPWGTGSERVTSNLDRGVRVSDAPGVVLINTEATSGEGMGTGMVLTADGQVLTNYHVVDGSESVKVTVADTGNTYTAKVVGADSARDVALLQLSGAKNLSTVTVSQAAAKLGDTVYAVGNGNGQGFLTRLQGKVTGINEAIDVSEGTTFGPSSRLTDLIKTDADVVQGYSGGPLLNSSGEVVGLTTAASAGGDVDGYATPISEAMGVVSKIRAGEESGTVRIGPKGALGVQVGTDPSAEGAVIVAIPGDSAAGAAGLSRGDIITAIDGKEISSASELASLVGSKEPGTRVTVTWQNSAGTSKRATVTLGTSTVN